MLTGAGRSKRQPKPAIRGRRGRPLALAVGVTGATAGERDGAAVGRVERGADADADIGCEARAGMKVVLEVGERHLGIELEVGDRDARGMHVGACQPFIGEITTHAAAEVDADAGAEAPGCCRRRPTKT